MYLFRPFPQRFLYLLFLVTGIFGCIADCRAQLPGMRRFGRVDGYNATVGYNIYQDKKGYMWIGTNNGAFWFDGNSFRSLDLKSGLTDMDIIDCAPYGNDQVLISPLLNNISYYANGNVINSSRDKRLADIHNTLRNRVYVDDSTGSVWLTNDDIADTLYRFTATGIQTVVLGHKEVRLARIFGGYAIGCVPGIKQVVRFDLNTGKTVFLDEILPESRCVAAIDQFMVSYDCKYFITYTRAQNLFQVYGIGEKRLQLKACKKVDIPVGKDSWVYVDRLNDIWVAPSRGGVYYIENILGKDNERKAFNFLKDNVVNVLMADQHKGIWLTTRNSALYYISPRHFRNALEVNALSLSGYIPKYICGTSGGGLLMSHPGSDRLSYVSRGTVRSIPLTDHFSEGAKVLLPLGDERYLVVGSHVALLDLKRERVSYYEVIGSVKGICTYNRDSLLVATSDRTLVIPMSGFNKPHSRQLDDHAGVIFRGRSTALAVLADKQILIGTPNGLYIKDRIDTPAVRTAHPVLANANITDMAAWRGSGVLIATNAQGLYLYDSRSRQLQEVQGPPGMPRNPIRNLYLESDTACWLATDRGALRILLDDRGKVRRYYNYTFYEGLPSDNVTAVYVRQDTAYVATTEGLGIIQLKDSTRHLLMPPRLYVNELEVRDTSFYRPSSVVLSHRQNSLLISLSGIAYESMGHIDFYYRLDGLNSQWVKTSNPEIRFSALPPGQYTFYVYATNVQGARSGQVALQITIRPSFWQSIYFKLAVGLLAGFSIFMLLRLWAVRNERKRTEKLLEKKRWAELELEAIKAQINPHFIYNCLNSIQYLNYKKEHDQAQLYLDMFARLIRMTMQYAQQSFISIQEEVQYLQLYLQLEKLRLKEKLKYSIILDDKLDQRRKMPAMLVQPYVENALKHGIARKKEPGQVSVRFVLDTGTTLCITVEDDGPGLNAPGDEKGQRLGLRLTGTRAESYNQLFGTMIRVHIRNKQETPGGGTGTIVEINIPFTDHEHQHT